MSGEQQDRRDGPGGDGGEPGPQHRAPRRPVAVHNRTPAQTRRVHASEYGDEGAVHRRPSRWRSSSTRSSARAGSSSWSRRARRWTASSTTSRRCSTRTTSSSTPATRTSPTPAGAREECARARPALHRHRACPAARRARCSGPSIMPGGEREAYGEVEEVFTAIAAQVDGTPCCAYVGPDGAGHYVKMVHNGIEYADMQLIAEAYDLLRHGAGLTVPEIAADLRRVEPRRPRVVPDRDHGQGAGQGGRRRRAGRWST